MDFLKFSDNCQPDQCHGPLIPLFAAIGSAVSTAAASVGTALVGTGAVGALGPMIPTAGIIGSGGALTLGGLGTIASGLGGLSAVMQGRAGANAAKMNARIAEHNTLLERSKTAAATEKQDRERRLRMGSNIAGAGASGSGVGSFGDVLADNAAQEELDLLTIKSEGLLRETNFMNEAQLQRSKGKSARSQGILSGAASVLSGVSGAMK